MLGQKCPDFMIKIIGSLFAPLLLPSLLAAQLTLFNTVNVATKPWDTRSLLVPANSTSSSVQFTVDASSQGGDTFDIVVDNPAVLIGLTTPGGTQVNSNNAAGLGYQFNVFTIDASVTPNPFLILGTHTLVVLPAGSPSGTYVMTADATTATTQTLLLASYYSSSLVTAGLSTNASNYRLGDPVTLAGLIVDATGPITNAVVTASVVVPVDISAQASVGGYQLVSQQPADANTSFYIYTANLTNSGAAIQGASADLTSSSTTVMVGAARLYFGDVAAGTTVTSQNTFTVQAAASGAPDLSLLQWAPQAPGVPVSVSLADSGTFPDAAQGDGLFSGLFTPSQLGAYIAAIQATGTSLEGVPFSRTALAEFTVVPSTASLGAIRTKGSTQTETGSSIKSSLQRTSLFNRLGTIPSA